MTAILSIFLLGLPFIVIAILLAYTRKQTKNKPAAQDPIAKRPNWFVIIFGIVLVMVGLLIIDDSTKHFSTAIGFLFVVIGGLYIGMSSLLQNYNQKEPLVKDPKPKK